MRGVQQYKLYKMRNEQLCQKGLDKISEDNNENNYCPEASENTKL